MEPNPKIDIKSEIYRAAAPYIAGITKAAFIRYGELPRGEVFKTFAAIYLLVGFTVSSIAGAIPSMLLNLFDMSSTIVDVAFIGFWPIIAWIIGSKDSVVISLAMIFVISVYIGHLRQRAVTSAKDLADAQTRIDTLEDQIGQTIDLTPVPVLARPVRP